MSYPSSRVEVQKVSVRLGLGEEKSCLAAANSLNARQIHTSKMLRLTPVHNAKGLSRSRNTLILLQAAGGEEKEGSGEERREGLMGR